MAQRDQVGRALGALDAGDPGDRERVALRHAAGRAAARRPRRDSSTRPVAVADRAVTSLPETSTMRAAPAASRCVNRGSDARRRSPHVPIEQHDVDLVAGAQLGDVLAATTTKPLAGARSPTGASPARRPGAPRCPYGRGAQDAAQELRLPGGEVTAAQRRWRVTGGARSGVSPRIRRSAGRTKTSKET